MCVYTRNRAYSTAADAGAEDVAVGYARASGAPVATARQRDVRTNRAYAHVRGTTCVHTLRHQMINYENCLERVSRGHYDGASVVVDVDGDGASATDDVRF